MPTVAHKVDALVRTRPGISRVQLCEVLGIHDVDKALRRLTKVGCIRSVRSKRYASYYPIDGLSDGDTQAD